MQVAALKTLRRGDCWLSRTWPAFILLALTFGCNAIQPGYLPESARVPEPRPAESGEKTGQGDDQSANKQDSVEKKPPAPTTFPQAVHDYFRRLREAKYGGGNKDSRGSSEKSDKESGEGSKSSTGTAEKKQSGAADKDKSERKSEPEKPKSEDTGAAGRENGGNKPDGSDTKDKADNPVDKKADEKAKSDSESKKEDEPAWYSAHAQATMVMEAHDQFPSPYQGQNSLRSKDFDPTSLTATLFLDARLWEGGEFIFNPELAGGLGFSNTLGMGGFPNGEITRVGLPQPTPYFARAFFRQTFGLGGGQEKVEDGFNQIAGKRDIDRFTFSIGKMSAADIADDNRYSHDPRTQFLNWSLMYDGAWDYPANVRGYTYGFAMDLNHETWAIRYGIFAEPLVANGAELDPHFLKANGQVLELEKRYRFYDRPGKLRLDAFLNHAHMGNYDEAVAEMPFSPQIADTRAYRFKYGFFGSIEQELTDDLGLFSRMGWNDGHSESWSFTEIDSTFAMGFVRKGTRWARPQDTCGIGFVCNGISVPHRNYLASGGYGFIIGDGALNYSLEKILEMYYCVAVNKSIFITGDFQEALNPAYNRDRGPVSIFSLRVHLEY